MVTSPESFNDVFPFPSKETGRFRLPVKVCVALLIVMLSFVPSMASAVAPIAVNDSFNTISGQVVSGSLASNDEGLDGPADIFSRLSNASNGEAIVNSDGSFQYEPNIGFAGIDSFDYEINDGAGGTSTATVTISIAGASDFLFVADPTLQTPEDTAISLGISVAPDLFNGGALQDVIGTAALFRSDSAGNAPSTATVPNGTSSIVVTGYSTQFRNTVNHNDRNDDYQLLNAYINLAKGTSSGRIAFLTAGLDDGSASVLDQYSWENVPLGQSVLSDPSKVIGNAAGSSDPTFSLVGNEFSIVETHTLETSYHVEFMTSDGGSADFLGAGNSVQNPGQEISILSLPAELEPAAGKKGFILLNSSSAAGGSNFEVEHKGSGRLLIDLEAGVVSGSLAAQQGETSNNTVTYGFTDYPLVDLRLGASPTPSVLSSTATVVGDSTAKSTVRHDPTIYINAGGELVIERASGFASVFFSSFIAEFYERSSFSSIASFVSVGSADALFDSSPVDAVDSNGDPIDEFVFDVPANAQVGILQLSWTSVGGDESNENVGIGFAVIDLSASTSAGAITFIRIDAPDSLTWGAVPLGSVLFGANNAGTPLFQSNRIAGDFTDPFVETARITLTDSPDGSRTLVFDAHSNGGSQSHRDFQGNAHIAWLGNEFFTIDGVPAGALLSGGSPIVGDDSWEIDFSELSSLSFVPGEHEAGLTRLSLDLALTGEVETIEIAVEPVADPPLLVANDVTGYVSTATPLIVTLSDSPDLDGSETQINGLVFSNVPASVALNSTGGTVTDQGGGVWHVDRTALANLMASGSAPITTTVTIEGVQVDQFDIDEDGVVEDGNNGAGADEYDELLVQSSFVLDVNGLPTVSELVTNSGTPVISGLVQIETGESFSVIVNGVTYTAGDGDLLVNSDGTWVLTIPSGDALTESIYNVTAELSHGSGTVGADSTANELIVDFTPPAVPTVDSLLTNTGAPVISGNAILAAGDTLSVEVNSVIYTVADGHLIDNGDSSWDLTIPVSNVLDESTYDVVASVSDGAGNVSSDTTSNELIVDLTPPPAPGVTSQTINDPTPVISGTTTVGTGMVLRVEVNGVIYTVGDGHLVDNGDGTWDLTIPAADALADNLYQVCLLYTSPSPRDLSTSRMPSSA